MIYEIILSLNLRTSKSQSVLIVVIYCFFVFSTFTEKWGGKSNIGKIMHLSMTERLSAKYRRKLVI